MPANTHLSASTICARCSQDSPSGLYATRERLTRYVCFSCLDELEPATVARYDGWSERESVKARRAAVARANFHAERRS